MVEITRSKVIRVHVCLFEVCTPAVTKDYFSNPEQRLKTIAALDTGQGCNNGEILAGVLWCSSPRVSVCFSCCLGLHLDISSCYMFCVFWCFALLPVCSFQVICVWALFRWSILFFVRGSVLRLKSTGFKSRNAWTFWRVQLLLFLDL